MKYIADDGTVCTTKEEMLEINEKIEKLLLPDKIAKKFGMFQQVEKTDWFNVHILKRQGLLELMRRNRIK